MGGLDAVAGGERTERSPRDYSRLPLDRGAAARCRAPCGRLRIRRKPPRERRGAPADAFFGVGGFENRPMTSDLETLAAAIRQRHDPAVRVSEHVFEEETHNSVFPAAFARGIRAVRPE